MPVPTPLAEEELDRIKFELNYGGGEVIVHTQFGGCGFPIEITRIKFTDAEAWHVRRLRVGNRDQIIDPDGTNASHLAGKIILDIVVPGLVVLLNIRRAPNAALVNGEVTFYGYKKGPIT